MVSDHIFAAPQAKRRFHNQHTRGEHIHSSKLCLVVVVKCSELTSFLYFFVVDIENEIVEIRQLNGEQWKFFFSTTQNLKMREFFGRTLYGDPTL